MAVPPADVPALSMETAFDVFRGFFDNTSLAVATRPQMDTTQHNKGVVVEESEEMPPLVQESDTDSNGSHGDVPSLARPQPKAAVLLPLNRIGTPGTPTSSESRAFRFARGCPRLAEEHRLDPRVLEHALAQRSWRGFLVAHVLVSTTNLSTDVGRY